MAFRPLIPLAIAASSAASFSSSSSSSASGAALPTIAVVGAEESLRRIPSTTKSKVNLVRVDPATLAAQSDTLAAAEGLLWIPDPGSPSAASDTLKTVWPLLPRCRWVHSFAAGVDGLKPFIDACLAPASDRVTLTNGRGAFSSSLGEYALASILYFNKQLARCAANRPAKKWDYFTMDVMADKTVGLVGYGSIGQSAGKAVKGAFPTCKVLALRRRCPADGGPDPYGPADGTFGFDDRLEFFAACDYVVCSLPSTPHTQKFVGEAEIAAMKPTAVFVSLGRGAAVDEAALAVALKAKRIGGAALDVFVKEPLPQDSPIWDCDNALITAHNADYTENYFDLGCQVFDENVEAFLKDSSGGGGAGPPAGMSTPVDLDQGY